MRHTISGLVAACAVVAASAAPAMACGWYGCSPCGYGSPFGAQVYVSPAPVYNDWGGSTGCGGRGYERAPRPVHQYYYVNQGPTYSGPGNFAPYPTYQEDAVYSYPTHRHYRPWRMHRSYRYGYGPRYGYAPRHHYGYREHVLRRYY